VGTSYALTGTYREVDYTYNQYGLVTGMTAPLSGTLPLSRSSEGAPAPANASVNSSAVQLATYTYEATFWNVTQVQVETITGKRGVSIASSAIVA
jgi:hypothetical protein